jgi:hypothetical protein
MQRPVPPGWELGVGLTTLPCKKKKIVEKLARNSAVFYGVGQGLSWAVEPRKERRMPFYTTSDLRSLYIKERAHQNIIQKSVVM